jgi:hypothetical protein
MSRHSLFEVPLFHQQRLRRSSALDPTEAARGNIGRLFAADDRPIMRETLEMPVRQKAEQSARQQAVEAASAETFPFRSSC